MVTGVVAFVLTKMQKKGEEDIEIPSDCCGAHAVCERDRLLVSTNEIIYFDDEELDRFKGTVQEEYTDEDIEEFRQVLYTMHQDEVDNWVHCLQTRGIELPAEIKEEVLLMLQ